MEELASVDIRPLLHISNFRHASMSIWAWALHSSFSNSKVSLKETLFSHVLEKMLFHYSYFLTHQLCHRQPHIQTNTKQALGTLLPWQLPALGSPPEQQFIPTHPRSRPPCPAILNNAAAQSSPQLSLSLPTAKFCVPFHTWEQESHATEKNITRISIVKNQFT